MVRHGKRTLHWIARMAHALMAAALPDGHVSNALQRRYDKALIP